MIKQWHTTFVDFTQVKTLEIRIRTWSELGWRCRLGRKSYVFGRGETYFFEVGSRRPQPMWNAILSFSSRDPFYDKCFSSSDFRIYNIGIRFTNLICEETDLVRLKSFRFHHEASQVGTYLRKQLGGYGNSFRKKRMHPFPLYNS